VLLPSVIVSLLPSFSGLITDFWNRRISIHSNGCSKPLKSNVNEPLFVSLTASFGHVFYASSVDRVALHLSSFCS
jgi:hypothetical protein